MVGFVSIGISAFMRTDISENENIWVPCEARGVWCLVLLKNSRRLSAVSSQQENLMVGTHILYATRTGDHEWFPYYKRVHLAISGRLSIV